MLTLNRAHLLPEGPGTPASLPPPLTPSRHSPRSGSQRAGVLAKLGHWWAPVPRQAPCSLLSHSLGGAPEGGGCWGAGQRGGVSNPGPHSEQRAPLVEPLRRVQPLTLGNGLCARKGLRVHLLLSSFGP